MDPDSGNSSLVMGVVRAREGVHSPRIYKPIVVQDFIQAEITSIVRYIIVFCTTKKKYCQV